MLEPSKFKHRAPFISTNELTQFNEVPVAITNN